MGGTAYVGVQPVGPTNPPQLEAERQSRRSHEGNRASYTDQRQNWPHLLPREHLIQDFGLHVLASITWERTNESTVLVN